MSQTFASQLGLKTRKTNIKTQKIDGTTLKIYEIVDSTFFIVDKDCIERFFKESFLLANVKLNVMFGMPFLIMSNANIDFQSRNLQCRSYPTEDILPTTRQVELIGKKKFVAATLNPKYETFVVLLM